MNQHKLSAAITYALHAFSSIAATSRVMAAADGDVPTIAPVMSLRPMADAANEFELLIYGDIGESWWSESVTAQSIVQQLAALESTVTQINVRINSYGGSVSDGMAIYNVLMRHSAKKVGTVDGVAMSSASLIAMACSELNMPEASLLMIHAPWGLAQGNANDMRIMADVLDTYAEAMAGAYAAKTKKKKTDMLALLSDGQDHYYTGEQAVAEGFADAVIAVANDDEEPDANASARQFGLGRFLSHAPANIAALAIEAARRSPFAPDHGASPASKAILGENVMFRKTKRGLASLPPKARILSADNGLPAGGGGGGNDAPPVQNHNATEIAAAAVAQVRQRNQSIEAALKPVMGIQGVRELYVEALADPTMTVDQVNAKALALAGANAQPLGGGNARIEAGPQQLDKEIGAMSDAILARGLAKVRSDDGKRIAAPVVDASNPFRSHGLLAMAEHVVRAHGHNTSRMSKSEIAAAALSRPSATAGHTTSDFPGLLGTTINRTLLAVYTAADNSWQSFCRITDLADFRQNQRVRLGSFDDLKTVNEAGNYEQGSWGDATAESIKAARKGRKFVVSREAIVNDDLQGFVDIGAGMANAAVRTLKKDIFALLTSNSGAGPVMSDGFNLFDATHHLNVATTPAAPSVTSFDAARQAMSGQLDPSGNDYLDVSPQVWLGPNSLYGQANLLNINDYDPSVTNKFQIRNIVAGMFEEVIGSPRLTGTAWYVFANPNVEPVLEVGFVDGQRTPRTDTKVDFDSDGVIWKVVYEYGTAAVGWRGVQKNAGA